MKPILLKIGAALQCAICGTAASALYFALAALACRLISSGFPNSKNSSASWPQAAQFGLMLGLVIGLICSCVLAITAYRSADAPAMRKKFASQLMLVLLVGAMFAAAFGIYAQWDSSHDGTFVARLARRQEVGTQVALANLVFGGAAFGVLFAVSLHMIWLWLVPHAAKRTLHDLILPFNVPKYLVLSVGVIGTIWGVLLPSDGLLQATYKWSFGSLMWCVATAYLCDFVLALAGRSSPYWKKFYAENKTDLYVCCIMGLTLVLVLTQSSARYSWYNLDLALLGAPFFLYGIFAILECATIKVAGRKLPLRVRISLCALFASMYAITILILLNVQSKSMPEYEALWYQINIFCGGLSVLLSARQIPYMLKQGKIEPSPVLLSMFSSITFSRGIYAEASRAAEQWNEQVKLEKTVLRKEKARASKRKRR
ncbi:hypothetical protein NHH88_00045 [Oxalobacteraceae bacterium OTU3CAMAD1]|nr:hypothetical protein NHH88_00045 [Oxalobacteraceae bacterium OTU3CAMAD1]